MACCFNLCKSTKIKNSDIVFFEFPRDKKDFKIWVECSNNKYIQNLNYKELARRVVCEKHFFNDSIVEKNLSSGKIRRCLKKHSLPKNSLLDSASLLNEPQLNVILCEKKMDQLNNEDYCGRPSSPSKLLEFIDGINFKLSDFSPASPSQMEVQNELPAANINMQIRRPPRQRKSSRHKVFPKKQNETSNNYYSSKRQRAFKKSHPAIVIPQPKEPVIIPSPLNYPQQQRGLEDSESGHVEVAPRDDKYEKEASRITPHIDKSETTQTFSGSEINSIVPLLTPKVEILNEPPRAFEPPIQRFENQSSQVTTTNDQICSETICPHYIALYEEKAFSHLLRRQNEDLLRRIAILEMKLGDNGNIVKIEENLDKLNDNLRM